MAEILLTAVINKSIEIAGNLLFQEGARLYGLKEKIDWLQREMKQMQSYIDDAKAKAIEGNSSLKTLIKHIQELAGDVEDLLDEFLPKIQEYNKSKGAICRLKTACIPSHAFVAYKFAKEIDNIKIRVDDIERVRKTYNITDTSNNNDCIPLDRRRLFLHADEAEVVGLDDDFNMLQAKLCDQDIQYGVISIVGMPGLGKTTLAKKLYRHVRDQFECSGLVYVSQQPRAGEILLDIAKQVGLTEEERTDKLEDNLRSLLKRKRCEDGKLDLSGDVNGDSFPQLEVLHIQYPLAINEVTCTDDGSMPKLKKVLITKVHHPIRLSERLEKLRI